MLLNNEADRTSDRFSLLKNNLILCSYYVLYYTEGSWYDGADRGNNANAFNNWLQCYYQDGMTNAVDHNKRTIWYSGPAGPLAPKGKYLNTPLLEDYWCLSNVHMSQKRNSS